MVEPASTPQQPPSQTDLNPSRRKLWAFRAMLLIIIVVSVESLSYFAFCFLWPHFSVVRIHEKQQSISRGAVSLDETSEAMHPYVGWVLNPNAHPGENGALRRFPVDSFGWVNDSNHLPQRNRKEFIVGIFGGSVALDVATHGEVALERRLAGLPEFADRTIRIVRLAIDGHKQPQQLMTLNYFLTLGAEFDAIVNIDGFNEIALPAMENDPAGVFAAYPRNWHARMLNVVNPLNYNLSHQLLEIRGLRQRRAVDMTKSFLKFSPTRNLIWWISDCRLKNRLIEIHAELHERRKAKGHGFGSDGPPQLYSNENAMYAHLIDLWQNANVQMQRLCAANGTVFVHVLQPNQHFAGSKTFGQDEAGIAFKIRGNTPRYDIAAQHAYPLLVEATTTLKERGVNSHDLTMLYSDISQAIYVDSCCHYNQLGIDLLATATADLIARSWNDRE